MIGTEKRDWRMSGKSGSALKKEQQVILTILWNESKQIDHAP
ncbi:hypothetical protein D922_01020 [Enterococcus faecalis 06-MB-DW-09]|nr:hypothetical protein D922_01020 [Enterococcus faecalis 06-MB-DW-09]